MTTADPETRIADLKARWEADPSSRIFVQLADEYRRAGNTSEAIEVLEKGLATQPNYVTAQAALGRCYLTAGDAGSAIEVLSRVMEQDPSHPLAGKLLVEAHLQTGNLDEATRRLEHYRMVADSGPEIEDLEQRLEAARSDRPAEPQPPEAAAEPTPPASAPTSAPTSAPAADGDDVFDLGSVELSIPSSDPFDLPAPSETPAPSGAASTAEDPFQLDPPSQAAVHEEPPGPAGSGPGAQSGAPSGTQDEPFGDLLGAPDLDRWSHDLDREGIFSLEDPEDRPAELGADLDASEDAEPDAQDKGEEATVTLGQLYMAQGHRREAARIFRSVLERDPNNSISQRALAELEGAGAGEPPPEPPSELQPEAEQTPSLSESPSGSPEPPEAPQEAAPEEAAPEEAVPQEVAAPMAAKGITERKISALEDYLHRLRQAART